MVIDVKLDDSLLKDFQKFSLHFFFPLSAVDLHAKKYVIGMFI